MVLNQGGGGRRLTGPGLRLVQRQLSIVVSREVLYDIQENE